jgi:hypothetical protein
MLSKLAVSAGLSLATPAAQAVTKTTTVKGRLSDTGEGISTQLTDQLLLRPPGFRSSRRLRPRVLRLDRSAQYTQTNLVSSTSLYRP